MIKHPPLQEVPVYQTEETGSRIIGSITSIGRLGPKHHGIILGKNILGEVLIAESMHYGYQISTKSDFERRYFKNDEIIITPNSGPKSNQQVAEDALKEVHSGGRGKYCLFTNNCESFSNRAEKNHSTSLQVVSTIAGLAVLAGVFFVFRKKS